MSIEEDKIQPFREALKTVGLQEKNRNTGRPHEFRIHGIASEVTTEQIKEAITRKTGITTDEITLGKYKSNEKQVANCTGSEQLYIALSEIKTLFIHLDRCRIDLRPNLLSCKRCSLLGHTAKNCKYSDEEAETWKSHKADNNKPCGDCTAHNARIDRMNGARVLKVNPNHQTRDEKCPIQRRHIKKYFEARKNDAQNQRLAN